MAYAPLVEPAAAESGAGEPALDSHWRFYAVDVKKKVQPEQIAFEMSPKDVRALLRGGREGLPMDLGEMEVRVEKLSKMQTTDDPGWWDNKEQYSKHCADEEVVLQQRCATNDNGKRPWRMIVRVPKDGVIDRKLRNAPFDDWSTDMLVQHSAPQALFDTGHLVGNDDMPVNFTGRGGVQGDFLAFTTRYELYSSREASSLLPSRLFEVTQREGMASRRMECLYDSSGSSLREEFFFETDGKIMEALGDAPPGYYYARVVTKGWCYLALGKAIPGAILTAVLQYNSVVVFLHLLDNDSALKNSIAYGFVTAAFMIIVPLFCLLLALEDMRDPVHNSDLALPDGFWTRAQMTVVQAMLYFFKVPPSIKELAIWLCLRGGVMGRALAKVNGARVTVLTWPSKHHYECDLRRRMHELYPAFLCRDVLTFLILVNVRLQDANVGGLSFLAFLVPQVLGLIYTVTCYSDCCYHRRGLLSWLAVRCAEHDRSELSEEQWTPVVKVMNTHFHGEKPSLYAAYRHLAPKASCLRHSPLAALGVVLLSGLALTAWSANWVDFETAA